MAAGRGVAAAGDGADGGLLEEEEPACVDQTQTQREEARTGETRTGKETHGGLNNRVIGRKD